MIQPDEWIDRLVARVEAWSPGFGAGLEPASDDDLAAFERALARPLPGDHRAFLARMGRSQNGLIGYGPELQFEIAALIDFAASEAHAPPGTFCVIGAPAPDYMAIYADLRPGIDPPPLVRLGVIDGMIVSYPEHDCLASMLFGFAFTTQCLPRFDFGLSLRSSGVQPANASNPSRRSWLPRFRWIAEQLGFVDLPGSGPWWACAERSDAAMMLFEVPGYGPDVRVAAESRKTFANLVELLCDNLDLNAHPGSLRQPT